MSQPLGAWAARCDHLDEELRGCKQSCRVWLVHGLTSSEWQSCRSAVVACWLWFLAPHVYRPAP